MNLPPPRGKFVSPPMMSDTKHRFSHFSQPYFEPMLEIFLNYDGIIIDDLCKFC